MRSFHLKFFALTMLLALVLSCSENPQQPSVREEAGQLKKSSVAIDRKELKAEFENLAKMLAQRAPQVAEKLMSRQEFEATFDELELDRSLPRSFQTADGYFLQITLERAQPCQVSPASRNAEIIFAPDPDRFQPKNLNHTCQGFRVKAGNVEAVSFTLNDYLTSLSHIPLYIVGYKEEALNISASSSPGTARVINKASPVAGQVSSFIAATCYQIRMKKDHDPWSNEECEVYTHPATSSAYATYKRETTLIFNGGSHLDAAGRTLSFPDVNNSGIYTPSTSIALATLDSYNRGWIAIEDDVIAGIHHINIPLPGCPPNIDCYSVVGATVDVQLAVGTPIGGTVRFFDFLKRTGITDTDDIWQSGAYEQFNSSSFNPAPGTIPHYALNDNDFWMKRENLP